MAGARGWVVKYFGEGTARAIEKVAGAIFGDNEFVECPSCGTPVPANVVSEWGCCPKCRASSDKLTTDALLSQRVAALAAGRAADKEVHEIDQELSTRRSEK